MTRTLDRFNSKSVDPHDSPLCRNSWCSRGTSLKSFRTRVWDDQALSNVRHHVPTYNFENYFFLIKRFSTNIPSDVVDECDAEVVPPRVTISDTVMIVTAMPTAAMTPPMTNSFTFAMCDLKRQEIYRRLENAESDSTQIWAQAHITTVWVWVVDENEETGTSTQTPSRFNR